MSRRPLAYVRVSVWVHVLSCMRKATPRVLLGYTGASKGPRSWNYLPVYSAYYSQCTE